MAPAPASSPDSPTRGAAATLFRGAPFLGIIDSVLLESPVEFEFDGAVARAHAMAAWIYMARDLAPDLIDLETAGQDPRSLEALESLMPELLSRAKAALAEAAGSAEKTRRIKTQLGSEDAWNKLPLVLTALRCRSLLEKAQGFGRAANGMADDAALALAMQSMPLHEPVTSSLVMMAMMGQVANPSRMVTAAIRIAGAATEVALQRSGFTPLIEAILAHAQNQIPLTAQSGPFGDFDLICRAVDRFHRLVRAITTYIELGRSGRWATVVAGLTKSISNRLEPRLRDVAPDLNKALRRRDHNDRLDSDQLLAALNGVYLLAAVRDSRDSLAVNTLFDQVWGQTGQALEIHIERQLQQLRANPTDAITSARLDGALKMAEIRFNPEYAEVLRRAKDVAERRATA